MNKQVFYTIISMVVLSVWMLSASCSHQSNRISEQRDDIITTAGKAGSFNRLMRALQEAGFTETLRGEGPFTVLAPTDEAFAKLPADEMVDLLKPENREALKELLSFHVIPGLLMSDELSNSMAATTATGQRVTVGYTRNPIMVEGARVIQPDIECANGVIHVIDSVLMPRSTT